MEAIERAGGRASFFRADVRSEEEVGTVFKKVDSNFGRLDVVVCSAGILKGARKSIDALLEEDWDTTLDTNLKGTFLTIKHAVVASGKSRKFRSPVDFFRSGSSGRQFFVRLRRQQRWHVRPALQPGKPAFS